MKTWLESTRARFLLLVLGTLLVLPSAGPRLVFDDHLQALMRTPEPRVPGLPYAPLDLFAFARPGSMNDVLIDRGMLLPWWTDRDLLIAFFRPLSSLTHVVDGWLFPHSARWMHVHSVLWYALLLSVVSAVYRRFVKPAWIAGAAFLLYAIDDTHGATVSWIANRNAILATLFGLLTLLFHDRWRRENSRSHACLALGSFVVGLLAGEAAIGAAAYIAAYALFIEEGDLWPRLRSIAPYAIVVIAWRAGYQWLGYGARGSDAYLDPGREPWVFLARMPTFVAMLLQGQLGLFNADLWFWSPSEAAPLLIAGAFATTLLIAVLVFPLLRSDRTARFWAAGAVGSLVPSASSIPGDRLLLFASVGVMALLAQLGAVFVQRLPPLPTKGTWRKIAMVPMAALFVRRVVMAPLMLPIRAHSMETMGELSDIVADAIPKTAEISRQSVVALNPPANVLASYLGLTLATREAPVPAHVRWLATTTSDLTMTRVSDRILRVRPARGFFSHWTDRLYRSPRAPLHAGERLAFADMTVTIGPLNDAGMPSEADFEFTEALEARRYLWLQWEGKSCAVALPPRVGETVVYPASDFLKMLFDNVMSSLFR